MPTSIYREVLSCVDKKLEYVPGLPSWCSSAEPAADAVTTVALEMVLRARGDDGAREVGESGGARCGIACGKDCTVSGVFGNSEEVTAVLSGWSLGALVLCGVTGGLGALGVPGIPGVWVCDR